MTCQEYDAYLEDPQKFRSRFERENERVEQESREAAEHRRAQEDKDRELAQSLLDEQNREKARWQAEKEREFRERRERLERLKRAQEEEQRERERRRKAEEMQRKMREENATREKIRTTSKPCPKCKSNIEKNGGW